MRRIKVLGIFFSNGLKSATTGNSYYHIWMGALTLLILVGAYSYYIQFSEGLVVTGMSDRVSWGLYISNFTFLVGIAAAAVMLVMPAYVLKDIDFLRAVLIGEGLAVAALVMCLSFVTVDLGGPTRIWHMIPGIGVLNWPDSMLAWDVLVLSGYLLLNLSIPFYLLYTKFQGKKPVKALYMPAVLLSVFWAIGIHVITAFLYEGLPAKPFWNSGLLAPRFLASAFTAGPALIIIVLQVIRRFTEYNIETKTILKIALIATVAAQINLIMLGSELFKEFYMPTHHSSSATYLFFGLDGHNDLMSWIWPAIILNLCATIMLTLHTLRKNIMWLDLSCILLFVSIWVEKGMGLIIPGFIPGPWGKIVEYTPSMVEIGVTIGIWALGAFVFTVLAKVAIPIEIGKLRLFPD